MRSKDFKNLSLNQLRGKWGTVILALLVPALAVAAVSMLTATPLQICTTIESTRSLITGSSRVPTMYIMIRTLFSILASVGEIAAFILTAAVTYGINRYLLSFVRGGSPVLNDTFSGITRGGGTFGRSILLLLLQNIFTFLWSLLFIIPGIIAAYRYSMAFYIMADNDNIGAMDALRQSKEMMIGHKWELFKLHLSFIGWIILSCITFGIGFIFLSPYMNTATTNFYEYLRGIRDNRMNAAQSYENPIV